VCENHIYALKSIDTTNLEESFKLIETIETFDNYKGIFQLKAVTGLFAISLDPKALVIAYPDYPDSSKNGRIKIKDYKANNKISITCTESNVCITLNYNGTILATSFEKVDLIRNLGHNNKTI